MIISEIELGFREDFLFIGFIRDYISLTLTPVGNYLNYLDLFKPGFYTKIIYLCMYNLNLFKEKFCHNQFSIKDNFYIILY